MHSVQKGCGSPVTRASTLLLSLALCGCAQGPLADVTLPRLCPRTSVAREVGAMAERIRGHRRSDVIAQLGAPARQSIEGPENEKLRNQLAAQLGGPARQNVEPEDAAQEKLVWGPLAIDYRRQDGQTVAMNCEVEMYAGADGTVSRVIWTLRPQDSNSQGALIK
jgi:hypothetical protein